MGRFDDKAGESRRGDSNAGPFYTSASVTDATHRGHDGDGALRPVRSRHVGSSTPCGLAQADSHGSTGELMSAHKIPSSD